MKRLLSILTLLVMVFSLVACDASDFESGSSDASSTGITELKLSFDKSPIELEAGDDESGYFTVKGNDDFSLDDIEFVSTNSSVATFEYDETALKTCVYYKINALKAGTTTVYAQTKDGKVKTAEMTVTVTGYLYNIEQFDDLSVSSAKRMRLRATVDEDYYFSMSEDEAASLLKNITEEYASSHAMNSITVFLFFTGRDVTNGDFIVALSNYAPEGDVSKAPDVSAGDYSTFDYDITIYSKEELMARWQSE